MTVKRPRADPKMWFLIVTLAQEVMDLYQSLQVLAVYEALEADWEANRMSISHMYNCSKADVIRGFHCKTPEEEESYLCGDDRLLKYAKTKPLPHYYTILAYASVFPPETVLRLTELVQAGVATGFTMTNLISLTGFRWMRDGVATWTRGVPHAFFYPGGAPVAVGSHTLDGAVLCTTEITGVARYSAYVVAANLSDEAMVALLDGDPIMVPITLPLLARVSLQRYGTPLINSMSRQMSPGPGFFLRMFTHHTIRAMATSVWGLTDVSTRVCMQAAVGVLALIDRAKGEPPGYAAPYLHPTGATWADKATGSGTILPSFAMGGDTSLTRALASGSVPQEGRMVLVGSRSPDGPDPTPLTWTGEPGITSFALSARGGAGGSEPGSWLRVARAAKWTRDTAPKLVTMGEGLGPVGGTGPLADLVRVRMQHMLDNPQFFRANLPLNCAHSLVGMSLPLDTGIYKEWDAQVLAPIVVRVQGLLRACMSLYEGLKATQEALLASPMPSALAAAGSAMGRSAGAPEITPHVANTLMFAFVDGLCPVHHIPQGLNPVITGAVAPPSLGRLVPMLTYVLYMATKQHEFDGDRTGLETGPLLDAIRLADGWDSLLHVLKPLESPYVGSPVYSMAQPRPTPASKLSSLLVTRSGGVDDPVAILFRGSALLHATDLMRARELWGRLYTVVFEHRWEVFLGIDHPAYPTDVLASVAGMMGVISSETTAPDWDLLIEHLSP